jgi:hypothetical protein
MSQLRITCRSNRNKMEGMSLIHHEENVFIILYIIVNGSVSLRRCSGFAVGTSTGVWRCAQTAPKMAADFSLMQSRDKRKAFLGVLSLPYPCDLCDRKQKFGFLWLGHELK